MGGCFSATKALLTVLFILAAEGGAFVPGEARAQSVRSLQEKIEALERKLKEFEKLKKELESLKDQLRAVRSEQEAQKAKVAKQEKAIGPLKELRKTLQALSKVEITGDVTGILQGASGVEKGLGGDDTFAVGSFDLVFTYKPLGNVAFVLDLEGIGGDGPDGTVPTFAGLNDDAGSTEDNVTVLEAFVEATLLGERLTITAGKIDLTNYVDANAFANDETLQFLSTAFVNNAVLSVPDNAPGVRARLDLVSDLLYLEAGAMSQDTDANDRTTDRLFDDVYGVIEVGLMPKIFGRQGNYRLWGFADGAGRKRTFSGRVRNFTAFGIGASLDQELTEWLGAFFRIGYREAVNLNYDTRAAWSAGVQIAGLLPRRKDDVLSVAYGEIRPTRRDVALAQVQNERLLEAYYRFHFTENFHLSALFQFLANRQGDDTANDISLFGARLQVDF